MLFRSAKSKYTQLPLDKIAPNPDQPRRIFDEEALQSLASSIKENGLLQPITVQKDASGGYRLIAGERRLRAAKLAGLELIPAIITEADGEDSAVLAITENMQRSDLKIFEEAYALYKLLKKWGITQEQAARRLGMSQSALANKLRLLKLTRDEQALITQSDLTERHARVLLRLPEGEERLRFLHEIIEKKLTVQAAEELVEKYLKTQEKKPSRRPRKSPKDVRLFVNTFDKAVASMKNAGIEAIAEKSETNEYIICTVKIPKAV